MPSGNSRNYVRGISKRQRRSRAYTRTNKCRLPQPNRQDTRHLLYSLPYKIGSQLYHQAGGLPAWWFISEKSRKTLKRAQRIGFVRQTTEEVAGAARPLTGRAAGALQSCPPLLPPPRPARPP